MIKDKAMRDPEQEIHSVQRLSDCVTSVESLSLSVSHLGTGVTILSIVTRKCWGFCDSVHVKSWNGG